MRIAKDLAENNKDARVLAVVSEITIETFRGPATGSGAPSLVVGSAIFGDGAGAMIIGSDPVHDIEKPSFEIHASLETFVPNTNNECHLDLTQSGLHYHLSKSLPKVVVENSPAIFEKVP